MTVENLEDVREFRNIATTAYYLAVRNRTGTTSFYLAYEVDLNYYLCEKDDLYDGFDIKTL